MMNLRLILLCCLLIFFGYTVSACQGNNPVATTVPTQPATTPTLIPTNTPAPTHTPQNTPTPISIDPAAQISFTHSGHYFAVNYPDTWKPYEQPNGVIILSPDNQIGYTVVFNDVGTLYSPDELNQYLMSFIGQNFAAEGAEFKAISHQKNKDGSIVAQFFTTDPQLGETISQVHIQQNDTVVFLVYISAPAETWKPALDQLQPLLDTFTPLTATDSEQATPPPPEWTLIGPSGKEFGFLVASDWDVLEQDKQLISVGLPENGMMFTASNFRWPGADNANAAREAALAHIEELQQQFTGLQHLPPVEFPLDTASGVTIDYIYTPDDGTTMAGSVITAVGNGKMHKIVLLAPTDFYEAALQWFNPMIKSFKFLSPGKGLPKDE